MSPRSLLLALTLAAVLAGTAGTAGPTGPTGAADEDGTEKLRLSAVNRGTTGQAMVTGSRKAGVRPSRESSREAMAAAAGAKVTRGTSKQGREENAEVAKLAASAEKAAKKLAQDSWQLPVARGVYRLTAKFGQCSGLWAHCHTGLDFAAPSGTPIRSVAGGVVSGVGWAGAYGNRTIVTLKDGTETWYCHQLDVGVKVGENVFAGQVIGRVGSTGNSTGPHLHLEVRPGGGDAVDPFEALVFRGARP
jgi:murein DD-endopeptidase MepM/ murein hydrolase activator NlpD